MHSGAGTEHIQFDSGVFEALQRSWWRRRARPCAEGLGALELALGRDETRSFDVRRCPAELTCLSGELWITVEGDAEDHILGEGRCLAAHRRGRLVVLALRPSRVRIASSSSQRRWR